MDRSTEKDETTEQVLRLCRELRAQIRSDDLPRLETRWEFGRQVARLGWSTRRLAQEFGMSRTDVANHMRLASKCVEKEALANLLATYGSWFDICQRWLYKSDDESNDNHTSRLVDQYFKAAHRFLKQVETAVEHAQAGSRFGELHPLIRNLHDDIRGKMAELEQLSTAKDEAA